MAKIGEKTWIDWLLPNLLWAICFLWYGFSGPSARITNWCNKLKQNTNAQTHEHNVFLIVVTCLSKKAYEDGT